MLNMQCYAKSPAGQTCSNSAKAVKGGNQLSVPPWKVPLLRHSYTILWYWYGIAGLIDKPCCGNLLRHCVDYNRILWHEKSA